MNNARRKAIGKLLEQIGPIRAGLENLRDEEQDYYDNMPESFQQGEKGDAAQTSIDALESAISNLESAESDLEGME